MRIPGSTTTLSAICRNVFTRNKPCARNQVASEWVKKISLRGWVELHFTTTSYILSFNYSYRYEINLIRIMYTANSSILYSKEKTVRILGTLTSILTKCFWAPLFQTNRIWRRINKVSENLFSLNIFTLNIKPFLWKYHMLPTLFRAALILLRSKKRKYYRGTQREYSSKPLKHSIVTRILPYYRKLTLHEINANR